MRRNQLRYWFPQDAHRETTQRRHGWITTKQIEVLVDECEYADGPRVIVLMQQSCLSTGLREYLRELEALSKKVRFQIRKHSGTRRVRQDLEVVEGA